MWMNVARWHRMQYISNRNRNSSFARSCVKWCLRWGDGQRSMFVCTAMRVNLCYVYLCCVSLSLNLCHGSIRFSEELQQDHGRHETCLFISFYKWALSQMHFFHKFCFLPFRLASWFHSTRAMATVSFSHSNAWSFPKKSTKSPERIIFGDFCRSTKRLFRSKMGILRTILVHQWIIFLLSCFACPNLVGDENSKMFLFFTKNVK